MSPSFCLRQKQEPQAVQTANYCNVWWNWKAIHPGGHRVRPGKNRKQRRAEVLHKLLTSKQSLWCLDEVQVELNSLVLAASARPTWREELANSPGLPDCSLIHLTACRVSSLTGLFIIYARFCTVLVPFQFICLQRGIFRPINGAKEPFQLNSLYHFCFAIRDDGSIL